MQAPAAPPPITRTITLAEGMTVKDLADKLDVRVKDVLAKLLMKRIMLTINSTIGSESGNRSLANRKTANATNPGTNMTIRFCLRTESSVTARLRLGNTRNAIRCNMIRSLNVKGER